MYDRRALPMDEQDIPWKGNGRISRDVPVYLENNKQISQLLMHDASPRVVRWGGCGLLISSPLGSRPNYGTAASLPYEERQLRYSSIRRARPSTHLPSMYKVAYPWSPYDPYLRYHND
jgi:hypothetical protein